MANFEVKPKKVNNSAQSVRDVGNLMTVLDNEVRCIANTLYFSSRSSEDIKRRLKQVANGIEDIGKKTCRIAKSMDDIASFYENTEKKLCDVKDSTDPDLFQESPSSHGGGRTRDGKEDGSSEGESQNGHGGGGHSRDGSSDGEFSWNKKTTTEETPFGEFTKEDTVMGGEGKVDSENGRFQAEGSMSVAKAKGELDGKYGGGSGELSLFEIKGEFTAGWPWSVELSDDTAQIAGVTAAMSAAILSGALKGYLGSEKNNIHGEAEGSLLGAGIEGSAGIKLGDELAVEANIDAEAYLAKGEVKGGISIFGVSIDASLEGMVGVQVEAGGEISTEGLGLGLGLGPIGLDLAIDWSEADWPDLTFWD